MAGVVEASMVVVVEARTAVVVEGFAEGRMHRPLLAIEVRAVRLLPVRAMEADMPGDTQRGLATAIPARAGIPRAGIRGLEIPRRPLVLLTDNGIPLAPHRAAAVLRARKRKPGPRETRAASTSLAEIAARDLPARYAAFPARVTKSTRMLPERKM
ncbi:MAG TPA: hypothetical protein VGP19_12005 [Candidatus Acidoferrales bacterium]|nr:hypothetical protein [Candidatus Acidoferrales bacterium]